jgi:two-component SAPR family response regulator
MSQTPIREEGSQTMSTNPSPSLAGRRVLIVEDEYFLADDLSQAVAQLEAEVLGPVATCEDAFDLLSTGEQIDLAVLDINLEGEAIFPFADTLIEQGVPFLFATGYDQVSVPARYQHVPCWEKPFDPHTLARALAKFMRV